MHRTPADRFRVRLRASLQSQKMRFQGRSWPPGRFLVHNFAPRFYPVKKPSAFNCHQSPTTPVGSPPSVVGYPPTAVCCRFKCPPIVCPNTELATDGPSFFPSRITSCWPLKTFLRSKIFREQILGGEYWAKQMWHQHLQREPRTLCAPCRLTPAITTFHPASVGQQHRQFKRCRDEHPKESIYINPMSATTPPCGRIVALDSSDP